MIIMFRIDYRLLHYQTASMWPLKLNVNEIVVANDEVTRDAMRISLMKMSAPYGCKLKIIAIDEAITYLKSPESQKSRIFLLVETSADALRIVEEVPGIEKLNAGLMKTGEGRKMVSPSLAFAPQDYDNFSKILDKGVKVESFVTPDDRRVPIEKYLKK